jgi:hypothetical protein
MPLELDAADAVNEAAGASLAADLVEKVNAGAQLAYALYHRDPEWWRDQPTSVIRAYTRATKAYGIGGST